MLPKIQIIGNNIPAYLASLKLATSNLIYLDEQNIPVYLSNYCDHRLITLLDEVAPGWKDNIQYQYVDSITLTKWEHLKNQDLIKKYTDINNHYYTNNNKFLQGIVFNEESLLAHLQNLCYNNENVNTFGTDNSDLTITTETKNRKHKHFPTLRNNASLTFKSVKFMPPRIELWHSGYVYEYGNNIGLIFSLDYTSRKRAEAYLTDTYNAVNFNYREFTNYVTINSFKENEIVIGPNNNCIEPFLGFDMLLVVDEINHLQSSNFNKRNTSLAIELIKYIDCASMFNHCDYPYWKDHRKRTDEEGYLHFLKAKVFTNEFNKYLLYKYDWQELAEQVNAHKGQLKIQLKEKKLI